MTIKNFTSEKFFERSKRVAPGGVHSPVRAFKGVGGTPHFIQSAQGPTLTDVDGNTFIDFCMAWGPLIFGHQDPDVHTAVSDALLRGWSYGAAAEGALLLAELIVEQVPHVEKVRFVNSGTEAVMSALRVARGATGREKILKFDGCYHGHVDSMLVRAGSGLAEMSSPDSAGISQSIASNTLVCPLDDEEAFIALLNQHGPEIAAVILEPLPANNGLLVQRPEWLHTIAAETRKAGALLIFDEVISGFRVALGGMAEVTGIQPDLVTYGKVIGGGFPVGAYGGRADLMDTVAPAGPVYQAGTLSANPIAMAAGLATLKKLSNQKPYTVLEERGRVLAQKFETLGAEQGLSLRMQHFGSLFWPLLGEGSSNTVRSPVEFPKQQKELFKRVFHPMLEKGWYLPPSGVEVGFLATVHDAELLDRFVHDFVSSLALVMR